MKRSYRLRGPRATCQAGRVWWLGCSDSQQARVEGQRQQILEVIGSRGCLQIRELDFQVAAEFPENLPARAAGRRRIPGISNDRDPRERPMAFRERLEHGDAFGADRESVGR